LFFSVVVDDDYQLIISCMEALLAATSDGKGEIWVSYLQIYCEVISDLLNPYQNQSTGEMSDPTAGAAVGGAGVGGGGTGGTNGGTGTSNTSNLISHDIALRGQVGQLSIRERSGTVFVEGLSRSRVTQVEDLYELLRLGDSNRTTAATNLNDTSSRSHAALIVTILINEEKEKVGDDTDNGNNSESGGSGSGAGSRRSSSAKSNSRSKATSSTASRMVRESTLVLVDLAGSER
jgi:hypothetical protein